MAGGNGIVAEGHVALSVNDGEGFADALVAAVAGFARHYDVGLCPFEGGLLVHLLQQLWVVGSLVICFLLSGKVLYLTWRHVSASWKHVSPTWEHMSLSWKHNFLGCKNTFFFRDGKMFYLLF